MKSDATKRQKAKKVAQRDVKPLKHSIEEFPLAEDSAHALLLGNLVALMFCSGDFWVLHAFCERSLPAISTFEKI